MGLSIIDQAVTRYALALFLLLVLTVAYDYSHIDHVDDEVFLQDIQAKVTTILEETKTDLTSALNLELFNRNDLNVHDLNRIKEIESELQSNGVNAQIFSNAALIFWTEGSSGNGFCKDFINGDLKTITCFDPFDKDGQALNTYLEKHDLKRSFHLSEDGDNILGRTISADKCFRSRTKELILLFIYLTILLLGVGMCLKYDMALPLIILSTLHLVGICTGFFGNYSMINASTSYFETLHYTPIDLCISAILLFAGILFITRRMLHTSERVGIGSLQLLLFSLLNLLLFISHIRLIQLFTDSKAFALNLDDISQTESSSFIFLFSVVLLQLGIFYFSTSLGELFKLKKSKWTERFLIYAISIGLMVGIAAMIKIEINPLLLLVFLTAYTLLLDLFVDVKIKTITWIIWWGIFFGSYLSALFFNYNLKRDLIERKAFLQDVFHETPIDKVRELKAQGIIEKTASLLEEVLTLPSPANYDQGDMQDFLAEELNIKGIEIKLFDEAGNSLFDDMGMKRTTRALLKVDSTIFFDELNNKIYFKGKINKLNSLLIIPGREHQVSNAAVKFNYYRQGNLVNKSQNILSSIIEENAASEKDIWFDGSDVYVTYRPSSDRLLISKRTFPGLVKPITLFSFLFCLIICCILILGSLHLLFNYLPENWPLFIEKLESLNSKIQIALILVILLSFLVIASITSSFLQTYVSKDRSQIVHQKLESLKKEFAKRTSLSNTSAETVEVLVNYESEIEDIHNVQLEIIPKASIPQKVDYFTDTYFTKQSRPQAFTTTSETDESISYLPLLLSGSPNQIAGIVKIYHGQILSMNKLSIFDFLGSIFNIYVFLFLIASVLAIFMAQSITRPLSVLNQKLGQVRLGPNNEPIQWETDDEIGDLIGNYNKMIEKLGESAELLAKKERDSAWREMAKQVAHEIKNPLTPMKLSIQYLERAISKDPDNAKQIAKKISATMMEQIDNLTGIAEAFSNFAELPQTSNVRIELNGIVEMVYNLFKKRDDMDIKLSVPIDPIEVYADKGQLVRILNNLVKNATESIPDNRRGLITIALKEQNEKAIISVKDNGVGISESQREKIFQPKFTTKDSGSGLGLAITANLIESMNGRIYFESTLGETTCFFIEMNSARTKPPAISKQRIPLE